MFPGCFCFAQQNYGQGQENISEDSGLRRCFSNVEKHQLWKFEEKKNLEFLDLILFFSHNCPCWCKEDFFFFSKSVQRGFFFVFSKSVYNLNKSFSGALVFDVVFLTLKSTNCETLKKNKFFLKKISSKLDFIQKRFPGCFCFAQQNYGQGQENISEDSGLRRCFSNVEKHQLWKFEEKKNLEFLDLILFFSHNCPCWCKEDFFFFSKSVQRGFFFCFSKSVHNPNKTFAGALVFDVVFLTLKSTNCETLKKNKFFFKKNFIQTGFHPKKVSRMFFVLLSKTMDKVKKTFLKTLVFDVAFLTLKSTNCENLKKKKI